MAQGSTQNQYIPSSYSYSMPADTAPRFNIPMVNTVPTIVFIADEMSARSYPVAPGATVFLFNMSANKFWTKTGGANGSYYDFKEYSFKENPLVSDGSPYATKEQVASLSEKIDKLLKELGDTEK